FINVGKKDGYDWMKLKDFLKEQLSLGRDDVFKVDVKDSFSFFNTEKALQEKVLAFFTDFKFDGRFVNVEVSEDKGRSGGGRGGKRSGGRRRNDDRPRGDRRSSRRQGGSGNRSDRRSSGSSKPRRSGSDFNNDRSRGPKSEAKVVGSDRPRRSRRKD
ncbi:MAG: ATP-dependent helicase, partial [Winogradskyella sp.]|nr:ATP-dependent helicase [Winogradskyella sp.]